MATIGTRCWQTNDECHGYCWAEETVVFFHGPGDTFRFECRNNSLKYEWGGHGLASGRYYMAGVWQSRRTHSSSAGAFLLYNSNSQGTSRIGFLLGPDQGDKKNFGAWVLVKETNEGNRAALVQSAKATLSLTMGAGLGELPELSEGAHLRSLLHPSIADSVLDDLRRGQYSAAANHAYRFVEDRVRRAAGLPATKFGANLMKEAFDPSTGKLGGGPIGYLRELFVGGVGFRNHFAHGDPYAGVNRDEARRDAMQHLVIASYLLKLVDQRKKK